MKNSELAIFLGLGLCLAIRSTVSGAEDTPDTYFFRTNLPAFFFSDHRTGAIYYQFSQDGAYKEIAREHMGIIPLNAGIWKQDTDGMVTIASTNSRGIERPPKIAHPMTYKGQVFLLWPGKSYGTNTPEIMRKIDSPGERIHVYNPFQISEKDYTNGTAILTRSNSTNSSTHRRRSRNCITAPTARGRKLCRARARDL